MTACDDGKRIMHKTDLTCRDILEIVRKLGYRLTEKADLSHLCK